MSATDPIVIVGHARTPMGGFDGDFKAVPAADLGAAAIGAAVSRAGLAPQNIDEVVMGCVLPAGQVKVQGRLVGLIRSY